MADINLNFGTEELDKLKKLLDDFVKQAEQIRKIITNTGIATDDDANRLKAIEVEAKKIALEMAKVERTKTKMEQQDQRAVSKIKEQKGIIGSLEADVRKYTSAWKSANTEAEKKSAKKNLDEIKAKLIEAKGATDGWGKALGSFQFKFNALGNIAANVLSNMTRQAKQFITESLKMAAVTEGISNAFYKISNANYLEGLRKATRGAVSDLGLMKAAVQANNFKIPLETLTTFVQFAGDRALSTGEDFDFLVESIVKGLGRKSVLILDNLGLSVAEINEEVAKTGDFMKGAANVIEREMKKAGEIVDTNATKLAQLRTTYQNMQVDFGSWALSNSGLVDSYQRLTDISDADISGFRKFWIAFIRYSDKPIEKYKKEIADAAFITENFSEAVKGFGDKYFPKPKADDDIKKEIKTIESLTTEIENLNAEKKITNILDTKRIKEINTEIEGLEKQIQLLSDLGKTMKAVKGEKLDLGDVFEDVTDDGFEWKVKVTPIVDGPDGMKMIDDANDAILEKLEKENEEKLKKDQEYATAKGAIESEAMNTVFALSDALQSRNRAAMDAELSNTALTEAEKDKIRIKYAKKGQKIAIAEAFINLASAIVKVWREFANPAIAIPLTALVTAQAGAQIATIKAQKFATGGEIGGKPHSQGGTMIEAERGEFVVKRSAYARNRELVNAINADDSRAIMEAMHRDKKIIVTKQKDYTKELYELLSQQENGYETKEFYVIQKGNVKTKIHKN